MQAKHERIPCMFDSLDAVKRASGCQSRPSDDVDVWFFELTMLDKSAFADGR